MALAKKCGLPMDCTTSDHYASPPAKVPFLAGGHRNTNYIATCSCINVEFHYIFADLPLLVFEITSMFRLSYFRVLSHNAYRHCVLLSICGVVQSVVISGIDRLLFPRMGDLHLPSSRSADLGRISDLVRRSTPYGFEQRGPCGPRNS